MVRRNELIPICFTMTSALVLWHVCMCASKRAGIYTHTQTQMNKS